MSIFSDMECRPMGYIEETKRAYAARQFSRMADVFVQESPQTLMWLWAVSDVCQSRYAIIKPDEEALYALAIEASHRIGEVGLIESLSDIVTLGQDCVFAVTSKDLFYECMRVETNSTVILSPYPDVPQGEWKNGGNVCGVYIIHRGMEVEP